MKRKTGKKEEKATCVGSLRLFSPCTHTLNAHHHLVPTVLFCMWVTHPVQALLVMQPSRGKKGRKRLFTCNQNIQQGLKHGVAMPASAKLARNHPRGRQASSIPLRAEAWAAHMIRA